MKTLFAACAVAAFLFAATGCESTMHKDECKCKEACTCPHCGKTADKCECGHKK